MCVMITGAHWLPVVTIYVYFAVLKIIDVESKHDEYMKSMHFCTKKGKNAHFLPKKDKNLPRNRLF